MNVETFVLYKVANQELQLYGGIINLDSQFLGNFKRNEVFPNGSQATKDFRKLPFVNILNQDLCCKYLIVCFSVYKELLTIAVSSIKTVLNISSPGYDQKESLVEFLINELNFSSIEIQGTAVRIRTSIAMIR